MGNKLDNRVILGSLRYKSAPDTDYIFNVPLQQTEKEITEYDRSIDVSLAQVYDDERQSSNTFRPVSKFELIFQNALQGQTKYPPFRNNLYYTNAVNDLISQCSTNNPSNASWVGYPQYNEFDFIRNDNNVSGYTTPIGSGGIATTHVVFQPVSASTYNWNYFLSYPYDNDYTKTMEDQGLDLYGNPYTFTWTVADGIPYVINYQVKNGRSLISLECTVKHNIKELEWVELTTSYNGTNTFQVYSLGNSKYGSDEYVINLLNIGYTGTAFTINTRGTLKRIVDIQNSGETKSTYYVRRHKIMSNVEDAVLVKAGFEQNGFNLTKKFEADTYTPNKVSRVSVKEGSQSYSLSFNTDFDINNLVDNHKRPLTELFFTVIWKGYFGWMFGTPTNSIAGPGDGPPHFYGMKQGWGFNITPLTSGLPKDWWINSNQNSNTNFNINYYTTPLGQSLGCAGPVNFTYVESLKEGDIIDGAFCEWNDFTLEETVLSDLYHKLTFNKCVFKLVNVVGMNTNNPLGYYYKPFYPLTIRVFSEYIEDALPTVVGVPSYATFSKVTNKFRWRDLYTYGFVDSVGVGVDYPFLNGKHYPFGNNIFRIIPEGTNYIINNTVQDPIVDGCE